MREWCEELSWESDGMKLWSNGCCLAVGVGASPWAGRARPDSLARMDLSRVKATADQISTDPLLHTHSHENGPFFPLFFLVLVLAVSFALLTLHIPHHSPLLSFGLSLSLSPFPGCVILSPSTATATATYSPSRQEITFIAPSHSPCATMSPVAATSADIRTQQSYARLHAKLTIRPEETLHRDSDAALLRLHNTVQVTKPVWSQLCGGASSIDPHGKDLAS